jgi:hypothetical protein
LNLYNRSKALDASIADKTRRFMNAETEYDKWLVFKEMIVWVEVLEESNYYLRNKD